MPGYGTPLSLTLPTINGVAKESAAAPLINTALSAVIARLESKVGATDLDIATDVSFKSGAVYSGARDLQRAAFQSQIAALAAVSNPNTVYVLNGDLHYIDGSGNLIQVTVGGAVNVSTTGGITGAGYGTGGVELNWDSINTLYRFRSGLLADSFADIQCADLLLRDGSGNNIRFQAPAIASDYTLTLPAALPGSTLLLQMSAAGLVTTSNSALNALTLTSGQHVTVSGSGEYKHGTRQLHLSGSAGLNNTVGGAFATGNLDATDSQWTVGAGDELSFHLPLHVGDRILTVTMFANFVGAGTRTLELVLSSGGAPTVVTSATSTTTGAGSKTFNLADTVLGATGIYSLSFEAAGSGDTNISGVIVSYDHP